MLLSKTSQYALRTLSYMAQDDKSVYISKDLHEKLKIPQQYLRRMLKDLSKDGFLKSTKGKGGGFTFAKDINTIYLTDIIDATEKNELLNSCIFGFDKCICKTKCTMHNRWVESKKQINNILQTTSLANMEVNFL